ncbi:MAG: BON domain-containing protein, partial [Microcoleaceae cyanobacterium]
MGFFSRIFGKKAPEVKQDEPMEQVVTKAAASQSIAPERVGPDGQYDESGLAQRVAYAFDQDPSMGDIETLWVAQTSGTVVLKGTVPTQADLDKAVSIASAQTGATGVNTDQV